MVLKALAGVTDPGTLNLTDAVQITNVPALIFMAPEVASESCPDTTRSESAAHVGIVTGFEGDDTETSNAKTPCLVKA